jgi:hypothetical protein
MLCRWIDITGVAEAITPHCDVTCRMHSRRGMSLGGWFPIRKGRDGSSIENSLVVPPRVEEILVGLHPMFADFTEQFSDFLPLFGR